MEIVVCIDCGWLGEFSDLLSEDGVPDSAYEYCPDCMKDNVFEFHGLESVKELLTDKDEDAKQKVLTRLEREHSWQKWFLNG